MDEATGNQTCTENKHFSLRSHSTRHVGVPLYSPDAVVRSVTRGAVHCKRADLDAGALLERRAGGKTKQPTAAISVDEVLRPSFLGPRDHVVHHVGQDVRVVLEKLARLLPQQRREFVCRGRRESGAHPAEGRLRFNKNKNLPSSRVHTLWTGLCECHPGKKAFQDLDNRYSNQKEEMHRP